MNRCDQDSLEALRKTPAFAVFTLDDRQWLVPQAEVQALETLLDVNPEVPTPHSIGAIAFAGEWWPVYCLSGEWHLLAESSTEQRICLLLNNGTDCFGLACDHIETLTGPLHLHPVPICMAPPDLPIQALVLLGQRLGCVTTTEQIARRIATIGGHADV